MTPSAEIPRPDFAGGVKTFNKLCSDESSYWACVPMCPTYTRSYVDPILTRFDCDHGAIVIRRGEPHKLFVVDEHTTTSSPAPNLNFWFASRYSRLRSEMPSMCAASRLRI